MIDEKWIELANREIDGRNTDEESRLLREEAARNPEVADYLAGLEEVAAAFRTSEIPDPPPDLKGRILAEARRRGSERPAGDALRRSGRERSDLRRWRIAAFVGGAAAVACLLLLLTAIFPGDRSVDERSLYGALLHEEGAGEETSGRTLITIRNEVLTGEVRGAVSGEKAIIEIRVDSKAEIDVLLSGSSDATIQGALVREGEWDNPTIYESRADLELPAGSSRLLFVVRSHSGTFEPLTLRIASEEGVIVHEKIDFR